MSRSFTCCGTFVILESLLTNLAIVLNPMNIVIPLGSGSPWQDGELRYCLRGVEKYLNGIDDLIIVGRCPDWLKGVIHIPCKDNPDGSFRDRNIYNKVRVAIESGHAGTDFLFFNDDHFLLHDFDANVFPYHYQHSLTSYAQSLKTSSLYRNTLTNTLNLLVGRNQPEKHFDIHAPIIYNSDLFLKHVSSVDWSVRYGYGIKSLYCNLSGIEGEEYEDLKFREPLSEAEIYRSIQQRFYFSIGNKALNADMKSVLHRLYPVASRYEK